MSSAKRNRVKRLLLGSVILMAAMLTYSQDLRQPNLKDAAYASASGRFVSYAPPSISPTYADLDQLTTVSTFVIIGTVTRNQTQLSADGYSVNTVYDVSVQGVLKGGIFLVNNTVKVSIPGGVVAFKDPSNQTYYAEVRTPWFKKMRNGGTYIIFMVLPKTQEYQITTSNLEGLLFDTTGGPQGVFEEVNGVVKTHSGRLRDPIWQYDNMPSDSFKTKVRTAATKI